jgi:molybdopterin-guanine dinucleotide biosynthesis protein A
MLGEISCIILAGGKGSRLGRNKVLETVGKRSLLQRVISVISSFNNEIIIVAAKEQSFLKLSSYPRLRIVTDIYPGKGILGGLYTGLVASNSFYNLVVASDMPFLNQALLRYLIKLASGFDAVVPRLGNMVEPLHAVYSRKCIVPLEWLLKQGNLKTSNIFSLIRAKYVETQEMERFDPKHLSIFNVNTKADLAKAKELAKDT